MKNKYTARKNCLGCGKEFLLTSPRQLYCQAHKDLKRLRFRQRLKARVFTLLGNRCNSPECKWQNADNSLGCVDRRCLQVDHVLGGGCRERKTKFKNAFAVYFDVLRNPQKYQLLCANCNWIKRQKANEVVNKIDGDVDAL